MKQKWLQIIMAATTHKHKNSIIKEYGIQFIWKNYIHALRSNFSLK